MLGPVGQRGLPWVLQAQCSVLGLCQDQSVNSSSSHFLQGPEHLFCALLSLASPTSFPVRGLLGISTLCPLLHRCRHTPGSGDCLSHQVTPLSLSWVALALGTRSHRPHTVDTATTLCPC